MSNYGDIEGYQYLSDVYCADCIGEVVFSQYEEKLYPEAKLVRLSKGGEEKLIYRTLSAEECLNTIANKLRIDHEDERSFDSSEFPKVILDACQEEHDICGACHEDLEGHSSCETEGCETLVYSHENLCNECERDRQQDEEQEERDSLISEINGRLEEIKDDLRERKGHCRDCSPSMINRVYCHEAGCPTENEINRLKEQREKLENPF